MSYCVPTSTLSIVGSTVCRYVDSDRYLSIYVIQLNIVNINMDNEFLYVFLPFMQLSPCILSTLDKFGHTSVIRTPDKEYKSLRSLGVRINESRL